MKPTLVALVPCLMIQRDPVTGAFTIHRTVGSFRASRFPAVMQELSVYICITGMHWPSDFRLDLVAPDETVLASDSFRIEKADPLRFEEYAATLRDIRIPEMGFNSLILYCDSEAGHLDEILIKLTMTSLEVG